MLSADAQGPGGMRGAGFGLHRDVQSAAAGAMNMEVIHFENENYVEIKNYMPENAEGFNAFWRELNEKYPGCMFDFVYNNTDAPEELLAGIGAEKIDSCFEMRLTHASFLTVACENGVRLVTPESFDSFAVLHDRINPDMYWTSERIRADLTRWRIFRRGEAYLLLSFWSNVEVYAVEAEDTETKASLLCAAAEYAFGEGRDGVLWMVDDYAPGDVALAERIGFTQTGRYQCYRV
jgi:hypothetical protein